MKKQVKNLIFDLGVVLYELDPSRLEAEFSKLGAHQFKEVFTIRMQDEMFDRLERGEASPEEFYDRLREVLKINSSNQELEKAWSSVLVGIPPSVVSVIASLRPKYRTFILSNTNEIHISRIEKHIQEEHSLVSMDALVDKAFYSSRLSARKPEKVIFEKVLELAQASTSDSLFIDDHPDNVEAARNFGLESYLFKVGDSIERVLKEDLEII